jgi:hypothetical protein
MRLDCMPQPHVASGARRSAVLCTQVTRVLRMRLICMLQQREAL